jgi:hypothetical protein
VAGLASKEPGAPLLHLSLQLLVVDLGEELTLPHEISAVYMYPPDIAGNLGEDRGLLISLNVGRRREPDFQVAAGRHDHSDQGIAAGALHSARLLILEPVRDKHPQDDREDDQSEADAVASQALHGGSILHRESENMRALGACGPIMKSHSIGSSDERKVVLFLGKIVPTPTYRVLFYKHCRR